MKKVITMVGTSLYQNVKSEPGSRLYNGWGDLKDKSYEKRKDEYDTIQSIKGAITKRKEWSDNVNTSAEIASIIKIQAELSTPISVYLIATDTIHSCLCAELIKEWFEMSRQENITILPSIHFIPDLQVKNKEKFETNGIVNLIEEINKIAQDGNYWDDCVFNITGGYKAVIPFMTILAQINGCPLYYVFEESEKESYELIKVPQAPISFDLSLFETHWDIFMKLESQPHVLISELPSDFLRSAESCLYKDEKECCLNSLGKMLWANYKKTFFLFYCSDEIFRKIDKLENIKRILSGKFESYIRSKQKTEEKGVHLVYDDGNNGNRIYYFKNNEYIYIYEIFQNENKAKDYINSNLDKNKIMAESKPQKLKLNPK